MKRKLTISTLNEVQKMYRSVIESDACEKDTPEGRRIQHEFLRTVIETQGLLDCGPVIFDSFAMRHDGMCWVIELQAISS